MTYNINKVAAAFKSYASNFDFSQESIERKYHHSIEVARNAKKIAESLNLCQEDVYLATVIGYLHDIGRFEQWTQFETFSDKLSFDHATYGNKILFEKNLIAGFGIDEKFYHIIKFAIENHNKFEINIPELTQHASGDQNYFNRLLTHCKIVRDADKLDLFNIMSKATALTAGRKFFANGHSAQVIEAFKNKTSVNHKYVKTILDRAIAHLAMAFDLNYDYSKNQFLQNKYHLGILASYKSDLPKQEYDALKQIAQSFAFKQQSNQSEKTI